jgi:hypothetical protein
MLAHLMSLADINEFFLCIELITVVCKYKTQLTLLLACFYKLEYFGVLSYYKIGNF